MLNLPLLTVELHSSGISEEISELTRIIQTSEADAIITGGLRSEFQRYKFNRAAQNANVKCFSPLWRLSPHLLMKELFDNNFHMIFVSVSAMGFSKDFLGKRITPDLLEQIQREFKTSSLATTGEGGEYESFVIDAPFFPSKIVIKESSIFWDEFREEGYLQIDKVALEPKRY
jgi:uncharacterized protein (TIGR00290 family)